MIINDKKNILIAPLDWGLGHTTRCIPIIHYLLETGYHVVFAGNDWQCNYINESFDTIETIHLDGYNVTYSKTGLGFMLTLFQQLPKLIKKVRKEQEWLKKIAEKRHFDGIISDNRYGLYHATIPSVIITHQLMAQTGIGNAIDLNFQKIHYRFINHFQECWVADVGGAINLSGKLGHPKRMPDKTKYIGLLSQFANEQKDTEQEHILILLSGPEPQRSILSDILWQQSIELKEKIVFVEGSNQVKERTNVPEHISWYLQLTKKELLPILKAASIVICRSGYSSLMDLIALEKRAILIPTPGQTEQEYLGKHLMEQGVFYTTSQKLFNLKNAFEQVKNFQFKKIPFENSFDIHKKIIDELLATL